MTTTNTTSRRVHVDHPGVPVPAALRPWTAPWPDYDPVDPTPSTLRAPVLPDWVADRCHTPQEVTDWAERQERAVVPFEVSEGVPLNPMGRTGRIGRNLKGWGENSAADPIVVAGPDHAPQLLLIRRDDIHQWAISGGMVDPGETAPAALVRELREETGVDLRGTAPQILMRTYVEDWRNTDWAWVCSTVALYRIPDVVPAAAADDAEDAAWWPLTTIEDLARELAPHGGLYAAHRPLLAAALAQIGDRK
ncbi:NUDIX domain-containing protein [Nocardiopsis sp. NPDC101807]|uniref:NUDIX domain-containing protein n=1 Tax=Nocardiopsis sp. NPDC101807 TaxID=3364339 RepID=UPI003818F913